MSLVVQGDGVLGKMAIYEGPDDLPYDNPIAYRNRVKLHTNFKYLGIVLDATVSATTQPVNSARKIRKNILAHGRTGGVPLVAGSLTGFGVGGVAVPLVGSVPVFVGANYKNSIMWTLGADNTYVYIHEMTSHPNIEVSAVTITIRVFVFDRYIV